MLLIKRSDHNTILWIDWLLKRKHMNCPKRHNFSKHLTIHSVWNLKWKHMKKGEKINDKHIYNNKKQLRTKTK